MGGLNGDKKVEKKLELHVHPSHRDEISLCPRKENDSLKTTPGSFEK